MTHLWKHYHNLVDGDNIAILKATPEFMREISPRHFDRTLSSSHVEIVPQTLSQTGRAATDFQSHPMPRTDPSLSLQRCSTLGATPEYFRRNSSSAIYQHPKSRNLVASAAEPNSTPRSSSLPQEFIQPPCEAARDKLVKVGAPTAYSDRGDGPPTIFPAEEVKKVLLENNTVEKVFHCGCPRCYNHSKARSESRQFDRISLTGKYATTFALLICLYRSGLISHFQERDRCLTDGPLEPDNLKFITDLQVPNPDSSHIAIDEIVRDQYMFHLKQFEVQHHSVKLGSKEALPITELREEGKGAYGTVYSFMFLPGYAGKSYEVFEPQKFARKVFMKSHVTSGIDEFNNLLRIYRKGTSQSTERWAKWRNHIMEALAGYEHGNIYFIIFPFAESTLARYLHGEAGHAKLTARYMWRQMEGVAGGLAFLHESYLSPTGNDIVSPSIAFHFDLKPENILIRNGVVMISDFGQSKFRKASLEDSSSGVDHDRVFFNYGPPEHNFSTYDKDKKKKSNYNFDIWSLGAIFSELITFHVNQPAGRQGFLDYRNARRQDDREAENGIRTTFFLDEYTIKPAVMEQHENLRAQIENRNEQGYMGNRDAWLENFATDEFFDLVTSMLSVITETKQRPRALKVQEILGLLCQKAEMAADRLPPGNLTLQERSDIWQQAKGGLLWNELPKSSTQILCYYVTQGAPTPTRCVILMQQLVNRQMQMLLLWHHGRLQFTHRQQELSVRHTSVSRQTGVIIDYFGHPPTATTPVDMVAETPEETDKFQLGEEQSATCYKIVPVTSSLVNCAALLFVNAEDAFSFQAALTGQYVVSNFSVILQGGKIIPTSRLMKRPKPKIIDEERARLVLQEEVNQNLIECRSSTSPS
ncbi:kinase-like domain-containing protein [Bisporella sp. PMI_857]|nr:kinase-like domain-containing protein [Bisporella sp. PMI_857]